MISWAELLHPHTATCWVNPECRAHTAAVRCLHVAAFWTTLRPNSRALLAFVCSCSSNHTTSPATFFLRGGLCRAPASNRSDQLAVLSDYHGDWFKL